MQMDLAVMANARKAWPGRRAARAARELEAEVKVAPPTFIGRRAGRSPMHFEVAILSPAACKLEPPALLDLPDDSQAAIATAQPPAASAIDGLSRRPFSSLSWRVKSWDSRVGWVSSTVRDHR
jgi:hypothetical protein